YEWLSGDRPFHGSFTEIAIKHALTPPPSLREKVPAIPPAVEQVVLKALAKNPKQRFERVQAFAAALEEACRAESSEQTLFVFASDTPGEHPGAAEPISDHLQAQSNNLPAQLTPLIGRGEDRKSVV